jgi:hypothetical protein
MPSTDQIDSATAERLARALGEAVSTSEASMDSDLTKEFASCREMFSTEEEKQAFDQQITLLLQEHGLDYVRGYVDALKDVMKRTPQ